MGQGQPETDAIVSTTDEGLKQMIANLLWDSGSVISDRQVDAIRFSEELDLDDRGLAFGLRFESVSEQVTDRLLDEMRIDLGDDTLTL